ncbi:MAG: L-threonylcarbamoyladenylate synthase, partial [Candidatus Uhrbacteria bacterium]
MNKKINKAVDVLRSGGTVVFPTETSYGLAVDATNHQAVDRLMKIKGRGSKTLSVIVSSLAMAKQYVRVEGLAWKLARQFWPGPLTIVLPILGKDARKGVNRNDILTDVFPKHCIKDNQIAIRVSAHPIARELSKQLGRPITATSANR